MIQNNSLSRKTQDNKIETAKRTAKRTAKLRQRDKRIPKKSFKEIRIPLSQCRRFAVCRVKRQIPSNLSPEEKETYKQRKASYEKEYPYLKERGMKELLRQVLIMEILLNRIEAKILTANLCDEPALVKAYDTLNRTYALLLTRMGITFVSRKRVKEKMRPRPPLEFLKEGEENET